MTLYILDTDIATLAQQGILPFVRYEHIAEAIRFCSRLQIVSFSESAILLFEDLRARKLNVSSMDLRIAAIVLERSAILVLWREIARTPKGVMKPRFKLSATRIVSAEQRLIESLNR